MAKTDSFGYFKPEIFNVKKTQLNLSFFAFLLIRSELKDWDLFIKIYNQCHYALKFSPLNLEIYQDNRFFLTFPVYMDNDTVDKEFFLMIKNNAMENKSYQLINNGDKAVFNLKKNAKKQKIQQLSFDLEDDPEFDMEQFGDEIQCWEEFKAQLKKQSLPSLGRIDYIIPINISTYRYFTPLFKNLHLITEIKYNCIESTVVENFEDVYYKLELFKDALREKMYKQRNNSVEMIFKQNE
jgi:hypothetical protein